MTTPSWRRILGLLLPAAMLIASLALPAAAGGSGHPYFDDQGTLNWYHSLDEAKQAAERENKVIFIEYGRRVCTNCNVLCARVLPDSRIRHRMSEVAVGLVAECDRPERPVYWLFKRNLPGARMLPFAAFVTADGEWITGFAGRASVGVFETHLAVAEQMLRKRTERLAARSQPRASRATPARRPAPKPSSQRSPAPVKPAPVCPPCKPVCPPPTPCDPCDPCTAPDGIGCPDGGCGNDACCAKGADDGCVGGTCTADGTCGAPRGLCIPGIGRIALPGMNQPCAPCAPRAPVAQATPDPFCDIPAPPRSPPEPACGQPRAEGRVLADAGNLPPAPLADDFGSPDGFPDDIQPIPTPDAPLPAPVVRPSAAAPAPRPAPATTMPRAVPATTMPRAVPATTMPRAVPATSSRTRIAAAVAEQDWGLVVRSTRHADASDAEMIGWNRQAHAWAHGRLAAAVRALRQRRIEEARGAVDDVTAAMQGESEAIDAERGLEAIELVRDLAHLSEESAVRRAVRKNAYEKMRGTRWAPLFSDCPTPSPSLSVR